MEEAKSLCDMTLAGALAAGDETELRQENLSLKVQLSNLQGDLDRKALALLAHSQGHAESGPSEGEGAMVIDLQEDDNMGMDTVVQDGGNGSVEASGEARAVDQNANTLKEKSTAIVSLGAEMFEMKKPTKDTDGNQQVTTQPSEGTKPRSY